VAFFIYLMAAYAETNRSPFDCPRLKANSRGLSHREYSSMKFAMFFMAEYGNMITVGLRGHASLSRRLDQSFWRPHSPA